MLAAFSIFQSGDGPRARVMLDEVVSELEPGPDRARALINLALVRGVDDDIRAAEPLFRQAIDEAGGDNELLAAAGENLASILFRLRERLEEAVEHASAAAAVATAAGSSGWLAESLSVRLMAEAALGWNTQAAATLEAALALQPDCEGRRVMAQPLFQIGVVWLWWDELDRAKEAFERLIVRAREMGDEGSLPYTMVLAAQVECVRGDHALAAAHADEGYEIAVQIGQETVRAYLLALRALAHAVAGEPEAARERAGRALELADRTSGRPAEHFALAALGEAELSVGRAAEASQALAPLVAFLRREQIREPGTARVVPNQVEALIALGELDAASELLDWYSENAEQLQRPSALAAAARCRGLLRAEHGDLDGALELLDERSASSAAGPRSPPSTAGRYWRGARCTGARSTSAPRASRWRRPRPSSTGWALGRGSSEPVRSSRASAGARRRRANSPRRNSAWPSWWPRASRRNRWRRRCSSPPRRLRAISPTSTQSSACTRAPSSPGFGHPYPRSMPEGDTIYGAARRIRSALVGKEIASIETHERFARDRWPERLGGRAVRAVDSKGKHLFIRFDGDLTLHSHLRMNGWWGVYPRGRRWAKSPGRAWLVIRTADHDVVQFGGPVLELMTDSRSRIDRRIAQLGPDILADEFDEQRFLERLREDDPTRGIGDALLDQRNLCGIGNLWKAEACFLAGLDPWKPLSRAERRRGARRGAGRAPADAALRPGWRARARTHGVRAHRPALPALRHQDPRPRPG